ncbi:FUSC family protein [Brucella anthropi]|uniref:FUSC family protein n=1 Tax=Brucella anthropi TaxID=529 RepID=A0A6L3YZB5_BRUAN|nr:FUSC family protein [Brucella anthropi]KAB2759860.1 hypothetical protein F9L04_24070 [Brucella anthropi]
MNDIVQLYGVSLAVRTAQSQTNKSPEAALLFRAPIGFALRTTAVALLALALAQGLGIRHPWWAAMTVWLVAQPTIGLQIGRGIARLVGTGPGALAGAAILYGLSGNLTLLLAALALWLALCAGCGSLFRHFQNYGFVVAGLTAAIVVLPEIGTDVREAGLALDRVLGTVTR